jgi:hypothetical protein
MVDGKVWKHSESAELYEDKPFRTGPDHQIVAFLSQLQIRVQQMVSPPEMCVARCV